MVWSVGVKGCFGDMGCGAAPTVAGLRAWSGVLARSLHYTSYIMNKRDSNKDKERQSDEKRTST